MSIVDSNGCLYVYFFEEEVWCKSTCDEHMISFLDYSSLIDFPLKTLVTPTLRCFTSSSVSAGGAESGNYYIAEFAKLKLCSYSVYIIEVYVLVMS